MTGENVRIKINLTANEFEIEGPQDFVEKYTSQVDAMLNILEQRLSVPTPPTTPKAASNTDIQEEVPQTFGEFFHNMPRSATDVDKILAAGYFVQSKNANNCFTTGEANKLLTDQGVKVANASECVKRNVATKRVFPLQAGKYRVSQTGDTYLKKLLGSSQTA